MEKKTGGKIVYVDPCASRKYNAEADRAMNYIGRRIAEARCRRGLSLAAFKARLETLGVSVSVAAINKWERGGSTPSAYQLLAVSRALELGDDMAYFMSCTASELNEEGLCKLSDYREDLIASGRYRAQKTARIDYIDMPVSSLTVSAGIGAFLDEENFEMLSFPASVVPQGAKFGVRVSGNSMEPAYHDGQIVWVRPCESLNIGEVGVFIYEGEGYLKVYGEQQPEEELREHFADSYGGIRAQPVLISYNKAYKPKAVSPYGGFQIVGKVL